MKKIHLISFLLIFLFQNQVFSQIKISGQIKDEKNNPIEFIEIQLQNKDSIIFKSELTNAEGKFILETEKGEYSLLVRQLGVIYHKQKISVTQDTYIGVINITEKKQQLQEVVIIAEKKIIKKEGDKLIINIKGNEIFKGKTSLEVLKYMPYVRVDNNTGNISIKGNTTKVSINGIISKMSSEQLNNYLSTLNSEELELIEITSNPSSKYDAEGGSFINILTKNKHQKGVNIIINSGVVFSKFLRHNSSIQINTQLNDKITFSTNFDYNFNKYLRTEKRTEKLQTPFIEYYYDKKDTINNKYFSSSSSIIYDINKMNQLGVGFMLYKLDGDKIQNNDLSIIKVIDNAYSKGNYLYKYNEETKNINLNYKLKLDEKGQNIKTLIDYYYSKNLDNNTYSNLFYNLSNNIIDSNYRKSESPIINNIYSTQIDYQKPMKKNKIEVGIKYSNVSNESETVFQDKIGNTFITNDNLTNKFNYKEQILAGYLTYSVDSLFSKYSLQIGMRVENTKGVGNIPTNGYRLTKNYTDIFPSLFIIRNLTNNKSISLSYSRRIIRPNYNSFNPTIFYLTDFTSQVGNPDLNSSYTNAFEVSYNSSRINLLAYYNQNFGEPREILKRLSATNLQYQWRNIDNAEVLGLELSVNKKLTSWWELYMSGSLFNKSYKSNFEDVQNINNKKSTFQCRISNNFKLPFKFQTEIAFEYNGAEIYGQYESQENFAFYLNVSKKITENLSFYIKAVDLFDNLRYKFQNIQSEMQTTQIRNNYTRSIFFSLIYNFDIGNKPKVSELEKSNNELLNRVN